MTGSSAGGDLLRFAALVALGIMVFSGGVCAGADGWLRDAALVVGLVAVALAVALIVAYARVSGGATRVRTPGR